MMSEPANETATTATETTNASRRCSPTRLSRAGLAVLRACVASAGHLESDDSGLGGCLYIAKLSNLLKSMPGRPEVARASLSRTLRRLWRAGWVELLGDCGRSLTRIYADAAADLQAAERDPAGTYARAAAQPGIFLWQSPEEYLAHLRRTAAWLPRQRRMTIVQITSAGRQRLTLNRGAVNRNEQAEMPALGVSVVPLPRSVPGGDATEEAERSRRPA